MARANQKESILERIFRVAIEEMGAVGNGMDIIFLKWREETKAGKNNNMEVGKKITTQKSVKKHPHLFPVKLLHFDVDQFLEPSSISRCKETF